MEIAALPDELPDDFDAAAQLTPPKKLGELIDERADAYLEVKRLTELLADAKRSVDMLDGFIMARLEEEGTTQARGSRATMSIKESVVPDVGDWDALYQFIHDNRYFHLLNRAPNAAAFRELFERGDPVPGVTPYMKRSLTFRAS